MLSVSIADLKVMPERSRLVSAVQPAKVNFIVGDLAVLRLPSVTLVSFVQP